MLALRGSAAGRLHSTFRACNLDFVSSNPKALGAHLHVAAPADGTAASPAVQRRTSSANAVAENNSATPAQRPMPDEVAEPGKQQRRPDGDAPAEARVSKRQKRALRQMTLWGKPASVSNAGDGGGGRQSVVRNGPEGWTDLGKGARVCYRPAAWPEAACRDIMRRLHEEVAWEQKEIKLGGLLGGRLVPQPRLIAYQADDPTLEYTYSGLALTPAPWSPVVAALKDRMEEIAGTTFNSCLLNLYRDGADHMSWHSDNEWKYYGRNPLIGSASFGARRDFMLRLNLDRVTKLRFPLGAGDALVMAGTTQEHWMHSVPKRVGVKEARINLTFRRVL